MKYTNFTKDKVKVSRLGFGLMRLPIIDNDNSLIDYKKSMELINLALENGITYFDTAYVYHSKQSEIFAGQALKDVRKDIKLATKCPVWLIEKEEDLDYLLDVELQKLQTDYIDFYLLHTLDREKFENVKKHNVYERAMKAKEAGKIRQLGFSFHDNLDLFKEIIDTYDFDFCQIQLNYLDEDYQAGLEGLRYAKAKGLSVVIMEPLRGGQLANLPKSMTDKLEGQTPASLGFSYLLDNDLVDVVLSGMNHKDQLLENIKVFSEVEPNSLDDQTKGKIDYLKNEMKSRIRINCTGCNYCMPCPAGVEIPEIFRAYNNKYIFEDEKKSVDTYARIAKRNGSQEACVECGQCESQCPQSLPIIEGLKAAHQDLSGGINEK
ncbi:MAG: aldo/keto reductase [Bacillota bacterium]|nr:aldo/keto reductase [Bacillota bacterium]